MRTLVQPLRPSKRALAAAVGVLTLGLLAWLLPATPATAQQGGTGALADGGVLQLHLGSTGDAPQDYLAFRAPDPLESSGYAASFSQRQSIGNGAGCRIALGTVAAAADPLVTLSAATASGSNPQVGFVSDGIGVGQNGEGNGQPCGRIDKPPGQMLTMSLGTALGGKVIDYAEIDVELKFGATLRITGLLNGTPVGTPETYASTGSDSGPDSTDGDNYRIRFPKSGTTLVNQLKFEIDTTGAASLEGGADGTSLCDGLQQDGVTGDPNEEGCLDFSLGQTLDGTTDSLFHLLEVDGILDCPSGQGTFEASEQDPGVVESMLTRQENAIDPETGEPFPCTPIPFNLDSGEGATPGCTPGSPQCILLQKDILGQATQFIWKVTWNPESTDYPETPTEFDFDLDGTFAALQPCEADSDGDGLPQLPLTLATDDPSDAVDPWCIMDTFVDFNPATGENTVTEWYFGGGDPGGRR